ncbi:hypothetical protein OEZ86_006382 [Tetradesmus obliquus]|nr:hypothetical protein OEZ86_006382 [Tetradesmus obliquus]
MAESKLPSIQLSEFTQRQLDSDVIDFSAGQPGPRLLPLDMVAAGAAHRFTGAAADPYILQYGTVQGYSSFRHCLAAFLSDATQHKVDPDELLITAGVSHGLDLACRLLASPGDAVLVEAPTYFLAGDILRQAGLTLVPVPTCDDGLDVDALEVMLQQQQSPRPKLLYTIPIHNNPAGTTIPLAKRQQLLRLAHRHDFTIVADEVYQLLSFPDSPEPPPPMKVVEQQMLQQGLLDGLASSSSSSSRQDANGGSISNGAGGSSGSQPQGCERVVSMGSFSKIMAPGMRLGWMEAAPSLLQQLCRDGVLNSGGSIAPLASGIAHSCLELGLLQQHLHQVIRPSLAAGCAAVCEALRREMPRCSFQQPLGGYFVWVQLPQVCAEELLQLAEAKHRVRFVPGRACQGLRHMVRLSFSFYQPDELQQGVARLAAALDDYLGGERAA